MKVPFLEVEAIDATWNEREIPLDVGDTVPPVRSCNSAAYYTWIGA
jgi:hypothetical protein